MAKKYTSISRVRVPEWANTVGTLKAGRVYDVTAFDGNFVQLSYNGEPIRRGDGRVASIRLDGDIFTGGEPLEVLVGEEAVGIICQCDPAERIINRAMTKAFNVAPQRRKSWTAYVPGLIAAAVVIGLPVWLATYWLYTVSWIPGLAVSILLDEWVDDVAAVRSVFRNRKNLKR